MAGSSAAEGGASAQRPAEVGGLHAPATRRWVRHLAALSRGERAVAGSKAAGLAGLTEAGLPVPGAS